MGPETVLKYSHQNLFVIIYSLPSSKKDFFKTGTSYWTTASSVKSISEFLYLEMPLVASNTYILPLIFCAH